MLVYLLSANTPSAFTNSILKRQMKLPIFFSNAALIASVLFHVLGVAVSRPCASKTAKTIARASSRRQTSCSGFLHVLPRHGVKSTSSFSTPLAPTLSSWSRAATTNCIVGGARTVLMASTARFQKHQPPRLSSNVLAKLQASRGLERTASSTRLNISFSWFGGNDNQDDRQTQPPGGENNASTMNTNLSGVMGIMDSMSRFKTSQRVGERTTAMLQDLSNMSVEGIAANGKVKVTFNGQQKPMAVQIDEDYLQSLLAELVVVGTQENVDDKNTQSSKGTSIQKSIKNIKGATSSAAAVAAKELGDVLTEAMQEAHAKSAEKLEEKMKSFYSDLGWD